MSAKFPTIKVTNAAVFATISDCHNRVNILNIMSTMSNAKNHCNILRNNVLFPKSGSLESRGLRDIMFASSFSHSKIIEHAGSMSNSIKTICIGYNITGRQKRMGNIAIPAIGIWTLTI
jgi:hypothetical protein